MTVCLLLARSAASIVDVLAGSAVGTSRKPAAWMLSAAQSLGPVADINLFSCVRLSRPTRLSQRLVTHRRDASGARPSLELQRMQQVSATEQVETVHGQ